MASSGGSTVPVPGSKIRTVIFVPTLLAERCAALAARHRASRSEVYRLAIEHGLKHVRPALKRLERTRPESYRPARGGGLQSGPRSRTPGRAAVPEGGVYARLLDYGHSYMSVSPNAERDDVRVALATEAKLLQAPDDGLDGLIEEVLGELFSDEGLSHPADGGDDAVLPPD